MSVALRLRRLCAGSSVTAIAAQLDIGRSAFSNVVNGRAELSIQLALRIEAVFGVNAEALLIEQLKEQIAKDRGRHSRPPPRRAPE